MLEELLWQPVNDYLRNVNISRMFKDVSNTMQNFMFMGTTVFEIAKGEGVPAEPTWYKVWVPKGLVQEGLTNIAVMKNRTRRQQDSLD